MYSSSHSRYRPNSKILDDLDTQPVREVRGRVLNDVPHNHPVQHMNIPAFQHVDVNFPGQSSSADGKNKHRRVQQNEKYEIPTEAGISAAAVTADIKQLEAATKRANSGKKEFTERMLRKGTPVWEAVPKNEWNINVQGRIL
ncbi:unnamed protein product, partial [Meganyctiphanes norvegica]